MPRVHRTPDVRAIVRRYGRPESGRGARAGATPVILSSPGMLTGKRFRLKTATMGIGTVDDKRVAVTIPADAIIVVTGALTATALHPRLAHFNHL